MKIIGKLTLMLLLSLALVGLSGCAEKEKASGEEQKKTEEVKEEAKNTENVAAAADPKNEEKEVHDFVLKNTKMVQIFNISRRVKEEQPDLGPFFVIRGIDERGQKSELWIKDMKIYEMINSN